MNNSRFELPSVQSIESPTNRFQPAVNTTEFLLQNNNSQQELQHASDNGYYTVLLVKDLLKEAYLAQTQKNYDKAVYFYRHAYVGEAIFGAYDHSMFGYCLNKVSSYE